MWGTTVWEVAAVAMDSRALAEYEAFVGREGRPRSGLASELFLFPVSSGNAALMLMVLSLGFCDWREDLLVLMIGADILLRDGGSVSSGRCLGFGGGAAFILSSLCFCSNSSIRCTLLDLRRGRWGWAVFSMTIISSG